MPRNSHGRSQPGSRVRRRDLDAGRRRRATGLRVTTLALTVVEAAVRRGGGPKLMDTALQRHTDLPALWTAHLRNKGRYGSPRRDDCCRRADDGHVAGRATVGPTAQAGRDHRVEGQPPVGGYEVDFAFRGVQGGHRNRRVGLPQRRRRLSTATGAAERHRAGGLAGAPIHLARTSPSTRSASSPRSAARFRRVERRGQRAMRAEIARRGEPTRCRMPVCRLLRVHSTGRTNSHRREPGQQLLEQHPQLQPGQVGAQAVVHALTEAQVRVGLSRDVEDVRRRRTPPRRGWPSPPRSAPSARPRSAHPPSSTSRVAVRRFDGDGDVHRTISSTAVGSSDGSSRSSAHCVGMLDQRQQSAGDGVAGGLRARAEQQAEEQVQLEVGQRRRTRRPRGVGDDRQHVVGRLGALGGDQLLAVGVHPRAGVLGDIDGRRDRRSRTAARWPRTANAVRTPALPAGCRSSASAVRRRRRPGSRTGTPGSTASSSRRVRARRSSSTRPIIRGVSPDCTSRRICECRGSSIMLSTWPAIDRSCSSVPPKGRAPPVTDEYVSGSRSTARVSA